MSENALKTTLILMSGFSLIAFVLLRRPDYLSTPKMLGALIASQLILAAVCKFKQAFFLALMVAFVWAGTNLPEEGMWLQGRWFVLGIGAVAGIAIYMKDRNHYFGTYHLVAFFCIVSAFVSALVSSYPEESSLKALSLFLLFVYSSTGARIAVPSFDPVSFFRGFLVICEFLTYATAVAYYVFGWEVWGTSNAFGAVMGVAVVPMLLWGVLTAETLPRRRRLGFALLIATVALMSSFARAAIFAAAVSFIAICFAARQYRLFAKGVAATFVLAFAAVVLLPHQSEAPEAVQNGSFIDAFIYKGHPNEAAYTSRLGPWQETWKVIKANPWFGSGFGTSQTQDDIMRVQALHGGSHVDTRVVREHGNSYLAIAEWEGLLGVVPFYSLTVLTLLNVWKVFRRVRVSEDLFVPAIPAAAVVLAGLVEGFFEDGLFAVGYYLCVLIWSLAFILVDLNHASEPLPQTETPRGSNWSALVPAAFVR